MSILWKEYIEMPVEEELVLKFDEWLKFMGIRFKRTEYTHEVRGIVFRMYKIDTTRNSRLVTKSVFRKIEELRTKKD